MINALTAEPRPTYRADGTPLSIQLFTVEGSGHGPYVALPLRDCWTSHTAHLLFTRATAEQIVRDMHRDECSITGEFANDGTLTFTWTADHDGDGGTLTVRPDAYGRYEIGGLWAWDNWGDHVPHTAGQAAFALGASEYKWTAEKCTKSPEGLEGLYARGREEAHAVSLRRDEPGTAAPSPDADAPVRQSYSVTWAVDELEATSPEEAARMALSLICRAPGPDADTHVFVVHGPDGKKTAVDLDYP